MSELGARPPSRKSGNELFHRDGQVMPFSLLDFWRWSASDLVSNATRGILAEYIVARALDADKPVRAEWDAWDLETTAGVRVEVKSAAYLQTWTQSKLSKIVFAIRPTVGLTAEGKRLSETRIRHAHVFVFCLLRHTDKATLDPLDLDQWLFYAVSSRQLDAEVAAQRNLSLGRLRRLGARPVAYAELREAVASVR